jgi:DNA anti-recombination protein RmuC
MGLHGMQIEENAKKLLANLAGLQRQLENIADPFGKLGTHLKNAQQSYSEAEKRLEKAENTLEGMLGAGSDSALLENEQGTLALSTEAVNKKSA